MAIKTNALAMAVFRRSRLPLTIELAEYDAAAHAQTEDKAGRSSISENALPTGGEGDIA